MLGDLAEFLRARRARVGPADAGLVPGGRRHVSGLRREELALLAGISVDYYVRLEQGRDRNPSPEVVAALARALRLDGDATTHLHRLASFSPAASRAASPVASPAASPVASRAASPVASPVDAVRPAVARLVDSAPWPAVLLDRALTVLRANELARLLNPAHIPGRNLVRDAFCDPATAELHLDPDAMRAQCVAALRSVVGTSPDDEVLVRLVGELSVRSEEFRVLWAQAGVTYCRTGKKVFDHPDAGILHLDYETLDIGDTPGHRLLIHSGAPDRLALLSNPD